MNKKIRDITFKEFSDYCNARACDGRWSLDTAIICCEVAHKVYEVKPLFGRKKAREKKWKDLKKEYFNLDAILGVQERMN